MLPLLVELYGGSTMTRATTKPIDHVFPVTACGKVASSLDQYYCYHHHDNNDTYDNNNDKAHSN